ncbi:hypothetical protein K466DRAFT_498420 [Polyporus arcularius HHB13444]|uniref:Fungal-type protein kinase domain-containing protein n=1 Tax=Polyporus arcularius HHB13444 TaxID=1314778 RepID=A0A5C3PC89_9APHY|nr:hypothetical protein K466DRAFT_498420 [Polyporus arcularius HHB13444]
MGRGEGKLYFRQAVAKDNEQVKLEDPLFPEASYGKPDFLVADVHQNFPESIMDNKLLTDDYRSKDLRWRQCPAFIEVKSSAEDSPNAACPANVKGTLIQGADYARMILASRPFQLFAYGMFICGTRFSVGLFDRCGITLSPNMTLTQAHDRRQFVRIIVRLLWEMSPVELGLDPTVTLLPGETFYQDDFPRFEVTMGDRAAPAGDPTGPDEDPMGLMETFQTVGPPLWLSYSLLGRGTSVWPALTSNNIPVILKTAWHTPGRKAEAEVYAQITALLDSASIPHPSGIAKPSSGGDVLLDGAPLSVRVLRDFPEELSPPGDERITNRILHRVVLETYGKPLWKWSNLKEFALALRDVVQAHKTLYELGVLHRDISAGNILIRVVARYLAPTRHRKAMIDVAQPEDDEIGGFLTDFELASFKSPDVATSAQAEKKPGETISGTPLFMATTLLRASLDERTTTRTVEHDLEALSWVIVYAVYKHALENAPKRTRDALREEFNSIFSAFSLQELLRRRKEVLAPSDDEEDPDSYYRGVQLLLLYAQSVHENLAGLLDVVWFLIYGAQPRHLKADLTKRSKFRDDLKADIQQQAAVKRNLPLTHAVLLKTIDKVLLE